MDKKNLVAFYSDSDNQLTFLQAEVHWARGERSSNQNQFRKG